MGYNPNPTELSYGDSRFSLEDTRDVVFSFSFPRIAEFAAAYALFGATTYSSIETDFIGSPGSLLTPRFVGSAEARRTTGII
jgi:hypothetical protein